MSTLGQNSVMQDLVREKAQGLLALEALTHGWLDRRKKNRISCLVGLLYVSDCLIIPHMASLRKTVFSLAYDSLSHWGNEKSYAVIRNSFYWPNMQKKLETLYIPSCKRNKSLSTRSAGPFHPLPVPNWRADSIAMDFVGPLHKDNNFNCILTITNCLGSDMRLIPCRTDISAKDLANFFFEHWYCRNGLPLEIISDCDKLFVSKFWKALHCVTGTKIKMSTSFHPKTDSSSERSNRMIIQALHFHVQRNQKK